MDIRLIQRFCCWRHSVRAVLILLVLLASFGGPATGRALDDAAELPSETATPTATIAVLPEVEEVEALTPTVEPDEVPSAETSTPTEEPTPTATPTPSVIPTEGSEPAAEEPSDTEQPESTTEPEPGALRFAPDPQSECKPVPGTTDEVALGGTVDYVCTAEIEIHGERLDPAMVRVDWRIQAVPGAGWQVQLLAPPTETEATPRWTDHSGDPIELRGRALLTGDVIQGDSEAFVATERLQFGLRLQRSGCGAGGEPVMLAIEAVAGLPDQDGVSVEQRSPQPEPFPLRPLQLPTVEPAVAVSGSLDFGEIPVDANGVRQAPPPKAITVTVSGLDQTCGDWSLALSAATSDAEDQSEQSPATLLLVSINDQGIAVGDCALESGCMLRLGRSGPGAPSTATYTFGIALVLPDQPALSAYVASLRISLGVTEPDGGAYDAAS